MEQLVEEGPEDAMLPGVVVVAELVLVANKRLHLAVSLRTHQLDRSQVRARSGGCSRTFGYSSVSSELPETRVSI